MSAVPNLLPTNRDENWRYANLRPLAKASPASRTNARRTAWFRIADASQLINAASQGTERHPR